MTQLSLAGKTALITGGGTGIGADIARGFAEAGASVMICGRRITPLETVAEAINQEGGKAHWHQADVSQVTDVQQLIDATIDLFDRIDILVNNAAISGGGMIHNHEIETWDQAMAVNLRGPFLMARAVLPGMRAQESGHILNISSEAGIEHYAGNGAYGVAKHALNALSEFIQRENQELGIRVDTICPGMVVTEMTQQRSGLKREKCLTPHDITELVLWLVTRRPNIKIGTPILIQTMENPWT
jgi:NAD(P)-dependent dehydrogenase (short-subunit alcohol dehydrogenase family)